MTHVSIARPRTFRLRPQSAGKALTFGRAVKRFIADTMRRLSLAVLALAFVNVGGADGALRSLADATADYAPFASAQSTAEATALTQARAAALLWTIDVNGDGLVDFSNPTHGGVRGIDAFGSGDFGAVRDAGKRRHHGVDYVAEVGAPVRAPIGGRVTRLGDAYGGVGGLRFVEITNPVTKLTARILYVAPNVVEGDILLAGEAIGTAQDLSARYPGITNHVHVELRDANAQLIDASEQLPSASMQQALRAVAPREL